MKADGKTAKGGSDQDDKEDFGEASGRSNGGPRKKIRGPFWKKIFGCVEDRIEIAKKKKKGIRQFLGRDREEIILEKDKRTKRREELYS
jgi:hypothetical protein